MHHRPRKTGGSDCVACTRAPVNPCTRAPVTCAPLHSCTREPANRCTFGPAGPGPPLSFPPPRSSIVRLVLLTGSSFVFIFLPVFIVLHVAVTGATPRLDARPRAADRPEPVPPG